MDGSTYVSLKKKITNQQRQSIFEALLLRSENEKLKKGSYEVVAFLYSVCVKTVTRIWKRAQPFLANGLTVDVTHKFTHRVGRKRVEVDVSKISKIDLRKLTNIQSLAIASDMSKSTLHRRIKEGKIQRHTNAIKPSLTHENMRSRLRFYLSMLDNDNLTTIPTFTNMFNYVHIDEKWFYLTRDSEKYYLLPEEARPLRSCKSKRYIPKIMFLAVVARPRFDSFGNEIFSGKIGIFPLTYKEAGKRNSNNRVAGTLETKPILSITKDVIRVCLIEKVLPAIRNKWPQVDARNTIYIQQDNVKPHINPNDVDFMEAVSKDGFNIRLSYQPSNSPDFNVLDHGFFRAIQSLQYQEAPSTVDELVSGVEKAFEDFTTEKLNNVFLSMQMCMIESMKVNGSNNYELPQMGKNRLARNEQLPLQLSCERELIDNVLNQLHELEE